MTLPPLLILLVILLKILFAIAASLLFVLCLWHLDHED